MRSTKRIGKYGTRTKLDFPAGRSFFVQCRNTSLLTSGGVGTYLISTDPGGAGLTPRTLFTHNILSTCKVLVPVFKANMKHLNNGTGSLRLELSIQDAVNGNFIDDEPVPEATDCDSLNMLNLDRSGLFFEANEGSTLGDRTQITSNVSFRPSVLPTICSYSFSIDFYVIFTNPPVSIDPNSLSDVTITPL